MNFQRVVTFGVVLYRNLHNPYVCTIITEQVRPMFQNIACYYMFLNLSANACKGDISVVAGFIPFSLPVFGDGPFVQVFQEDNGKEC